jgi:hypothetical protein
VRFRVIELCTISPFYWFQFSDLFFLLVLDLRIVGFVPVITEQNTEHELPPFFDYDLSQFVASVFTGKPAINSVIFIP